MNAVLTMVLTNAVLATGMFALVFVFKSRVRNPAVLHLLWGVVLLKLLTPPMYAPQLPWLPAVESGISETTPVHSASPFGTDNLPITNHVGMPVLPSAPMEQIGQTAATSKAAHDAPQENSGRIAASSIGPVIVLMGAWLVGAFLLWGLSIWRVARLQRFLKFGKPASVDVQQTAAKLAKQLGLRHCPIIWVVPGHISPMLWAFFNSAMIVVPTELFDELDEPSRQTLLLHELVHYRRGDHYVRWLELIVLGLYWWHPVVWLLRREIRNAEELACDTMVVATRPGDRRLYAEMLVQTIAFISDAGVPSLATGMSTKTNVEVRLRAIMCSTINLCATRRINAVVSMLAILVLPLAPVVVRAQRIDVKPSESKSRERFLHTVPKPDGAIPYLEIALSPEESAARAKSRKYKIHVNLNAPEGRKTGRVSARLVHKGNSYTSQWSSLSAPANDIEFSPSEEGTRSFLIVDAEGFAPVRSPEFVIREHMPDLNVTLAPEVLVPVRGRVVDQNGAAVAGARVRLALQVYGSEQTFPWGLEQLTDSGGRFEIKHARLGDRIRVRIDHPGTGGAETGLLSLDTREPRTVPDLKIGKPDQEVGGIVQDHNGLPVENAKVRYNGEPKVETITDADGKFRLTGMPTGTVSLTIESAGFPRTTEEVRAGRLDHKISVNRTSKQDTLHYEVAVILRPRDGKEVANVTLYFCVDHGNLLYWMPNRKGNSYKMGFAEEVRRYKDQQFIVVVAADGYAWTQSAPVPNQRNPKPILVDLEPAASLTLRGRVIDDSGRPIAGASVGLSKSLTSQAADEPWRYINVERSAILEKLPRTDADGKFELPGIQANSRIAVYINKPGYSGIWSEQVVAEKPENVQLPDLRLSAATGEISGQVVDPDGLPVPDAIVQNHDIAPVMTNTDAQGRFRLHQVPNREIRLRVNAESGRWMEKVTPNAGDLKVKLKPER